MNGPVLSASKKSGPKIVQVNSIDVPVISSGKRDYDIVTVFVVAKSKLAVKTVCYWMPRIQAALLQYFHSKPMAKSAFGKLHQGGYDKKLFEIVREAMRNSKSIIRAHAIGGFHVPLNTIPWAKSAKFEKCKKKDKKKDKKKGKK